jgi:hypothetical protein
MILELVLLVEGGSPVDLHQQEVTGNLTLQLLQKVDTPDSLATFC